MKIMISWLIQCIAQTRSDKARISHCYVMTLQCCISLFSNIYCEQFKLHKNIIASRNEYNSSYYMEESVLLGTKPLVDSIRHFIRDPSGVFSVCHLCECRIVQ